MADNKEGVCFTLSPAIIKNLKAYAESRNLSASILAEVAIRAYLRTKKVQA